MSELQWKYALYDLRNQIASGELLGGSKLRASHLATEMNISRTPISEALIKLEGEGLLIRDKSGFTVRSFTLEEVHDAINLRGLLEAAAVQKAAQKGLTSLQHKTLIEKLIEIDRVIEKGNVSGYDQLNHEFHLYLVELSDSDILISEVKRSYRLPFAGPSAFPTLASDSQRFRASLSIGQYHHQQIVSALFNQDGARAFSLMSEHAQLAHENVRVASKSRTRAPQLAMVRQAT